MARITSGSVLLLSSVALTACGSAPQRTAAAPVAEPAPAPVAVIVPAAPAPVVEAEPPPLPSSCATNEGKLCLPDAGFASRLCERSYPEVALTFFAKGTPWTRGYLRRDTESWNANSRHARKARLKLDEEVVVLSMKGPSKGTIVVGDGRSYEALRFDGTCVSLSSDELGFTKPWAPKRAAVPWDNLEPGTQTPLLASKPVTAALAALRKACKVDTNDDKRCHEAEAAFGLAVFGALTPTMLPEPARRPAGPAVAVAAHVGDR
jgi:hypothetical protein